MCAGIAKYLTKHKAEVCGMLLTEYNETEVMEMFYADGRTEGHVQDIRNLMEALHLPAARCMELLKIPEEKRPFYLELLGESV